MPSLILYGGTFDPIHFGHIHSAVNIQSHFHFSELQFLPCKMPLLKDNARASGAERLHMIQLAIAHLPAQLNITVNEIELNRPTPSYTVTTLELLREMHGNTLAISLIIGADAFMNLTQWHEWKRLFELANILVIEREGFDLKNCSTQLKALLKKRLSESLDCLKEEPHGIICTYDAGNYPISSTEIRKAIKNGKEVSGLVPNEVLEYILKYHLYQ